MIEVNNLSEDQRKSELKHSQEDLQKTTDSLVAVRENIANLKHELKAARQTNEELAVSFLQKWSFGAESSPELEQALSVRRSVQLNIERLDNEVSGLKGLESGLQEKVDVLEQHIALLNDCIKLMRVIKARQDLVAPPPPIGLAEFRAELPATMPQLGTNTSASSSTSSNSGSTGPVPTEDAQPPQPALSAPSPLSGSVFNQRSHSPSSQSTKEEAERPDPSLG